MHNLNSEQTNSHQLSAKKQLLAGKIRNKIELDLYITDSFY
jgi:hypothetical protein